MAPIRSTIAPMNLRDERGRIELLDILFVLGMLLLLIVMPLVIAIP